MPAYNEEGIIEKSVRDYYDEIVRKVDHAELIIVDDWSTDNTPLILKNLSKELPKLKIAKTSVNSGHGAALRLGLELAKNEFVFHTDSDYQHDPREFWKLYPFIDQHDIVTGYRAERHDPPHRKFITAMVRLSGRMLFHVALKDMNCPFRIYRKSTLDTLLKVVDKKAFAPSIMLCLAASFYGVRMKEVAVTHYPRSTGRTSIAGFRLTSICLRCFKDLLILRKNLAGNTITVREKAQR